MRRCDSMTDRLPADPPSPFVETGCRRLAAQAPAARRALDVAMGRGRHAVRAGGGGVRVFGVDNAISRRSSPRVERRACAADIGCAAWCADLTASPLARARGSTLIVVARYLQRDLFPALIAALTPGGAIVYETFTERSVARGRGPHVARSSAAAMVSCASGSTGSRCCSTRKSTSRTRSRRSSARRVRVVIQRRAASLSGRTQSDRTSGFAAASTRPGSPPPCASSP